MTRSTRLVLMVLASVSVVFFIVAVVTRISFPYDLTMGESVQAVAVRRLLSGHPLYLAPTPEYAAPVYTPLSFVADALLARVFGFTLPVLRVLSIVSTL